MAAVQHQPFQVLVHQGERGGRATLNDTADTGWWGMAAHQAEQCRLAAGPAPVPALPLRGVRETLVSLPCVSVMVDIVFPFRKMSTKPDQAHRRSKRSLRA